MLLSRRRCDFVHAVERNFGGDPMFASPLKGEVIMELKQFKPETGISARLRLDPETPSLYAWKIEASDRTPVEGIGTLKDLEAYLSASDLPLRWTPAEIIKRTRNMEHEGQGIYKHRGGGVPWTLLWVALRHL